MRAGSINPNTFQDQIYKYGSLGNPDATVRRAALDHILESVEIAQRLGQLDPQGRAQYEKNLARFNQRVDAKEKEWAPLVQKLHGVKVATYHKSWTYASQWLGMEEIGYVEPKPGIPPDPQHLARLISVMKEDGAKLLLMENFYNRSVASLVAEKAGAKLLTLPTDVGAEPAIKDWFTLVDAVLRQLSPAL